MQGGGNKRQTVAEPKGNRMSDSFYSWYFLSDAGDEYGGSAVADTGRYYPGWTFDTGLGLYVVYEEFAYGFDLTPSGYEDGDVFTTYYLDQILGQLQTWSNGAFPTGTLGLGSEYDYAYTGVGTFSGYDDFGAGGLYEVDVSTPLFDAPFYLAAYPDVAASGLDPQAHYMTWGWTEGRDPNPYFDTDGYLAAYPDVAATGINPLEHYAVYGWHEGRDPSASFDTVTYLTAYPDVAAAGINPLEHFLHYGIAEGRQPFGDGVFA